MERRANGVAMARYPMFIISAALVGEADVDGETDSPAVIVGFSRQVVPENTTLSA